MKNALLIFKVMFWLVVAYIPLALDNEITNFMVNQNCMPGTECLELAMPLINQIGLVSWAAKILLWPLSFWHLGWGWLWRKYFFKRLSQSEIGV